MQELPNPSVTGRGMIATEFRTSHAHSGNMHVYAAGVSNSSCMDESEFLRDRDRLERAVLSIEKPFFYISTCSINSGEINSPYIEHKCKMEALTLTHPLARVIRLPQVAGRSKNPNTLLNHLYQKIVTGEEINIWLNASRNVIDVVDVASIAVHIFKNYKIEEIPKIFNIANPFSTSILDLVEKFEIHTKITAKKNKINKGNIQIINTDWIMPSIQQLGIKFHSNYITNIIERYYDKSN